MNPAGNLQPEGNLVPIQTSESKERNEKLPPKLLDAKEWPLWQLRVKLHFKALSLWDLVTNERPVPEDPDLLQKYLKEQARAHSHILRHWDQNTKHLLPRMTPL